MEETSPLFSLSIDSTTRASLQETAKWARFLAIVGFVFLGFMLLMGLYMSFTLGRFEAQYERGGLMGAWGAGMAVVYIILAVLAFFPLLYTLRFANQMRNALDSNDQGKLNTAFQHLKAGYRYMGVMTIVWLVLMLLSLVVSIAGLAIN